MPSVSKKQHNLMAAVAKNPKFAKKVGIPQNVGEDFLKADKGKQFARGGEMKESKKMMAKEVAFMKSKGAPKSMIKHEQEEMTMKRGGKVKKMADGGSLYNRTPALPTSASEKARQKMATRPTVGMKKGGRAKCYDDGGDVRTQGTPDARRAQDSRPMPRATLPSQAKIPTLPSQASDRAKAIMAARLAARTPAVTPAPAAAPVVTPTPVVVPPAVTPAETRVSAPAPTPAPTIAPEKLSPTTNMPKSFVSTPFDPDYYASNPFIGPVLKKGGTVRGEHAVQKKGHTKGKMVKMATGGSVSSASRRGDGCASKGKTRGKMV